MSEQKILIVGAGGQVGFELSTAETSYHIIALTRNDLDITDQEAVSDTIQKYQPDIVINSAAYTAVDKAEEEQELAFSINRDAVKNLALACREINIPLLHISTDYVFDGEKESAYTEKDPVSPKSIYGLSKAEGEVELRNILSQHIIIRTSWVFSATGNNFVKTMLRLGKDRDNLSIVADQRGCPTSARSIAQVLLAIAECYLEGKDVEWGTYHYSNKPESNWFGFAQTIFQLSHEIYQTSVPKLNAITTSDYPTAAMRPLNSVMDCSKLEKAFSIGAVLWQDELKQVLLASGAD